MKEQARLEEAEAKAGIDRKKCELKTDLNLLHCKREVAVAETELHVVEQATTNSSIGSSHESVASERVKSFVEEQNQILLEKTPTSARDIRVERTYSGGICGERSQTDYDKCVNNDMHANDNSKCIEGMGKSSTYQHKHDHLMN